MKEFTRFAIATALYSTAWSMLEPVLPLYIMALGGSEATVGAIISLPALVPVALALHVGLLTERLGARPVMLLGCSALAIGHIWFGLAGGLLSVVGAKTLVGMANLLLIIPAQNWVVHKSSPEQLYQQFGSYTFVISVGQVVGPGIAGWLLDHAQHWLPLDFGGFRSVFGLAAVLSMVAAWVYTSLSDVERTGAPHRHRGRLRSVIGMAAGGPLLRVLVIGMLFWFAIALRGTYFPLYMERIGIGPTGIGLVLSAYAMASLMMRPLLGYMVRHVGQARLLVTGFLVISPAVGLIPFTRHFWALMLLASVWGIAHGLSVPTSVAMVPDLVPPADRSVAIGLRVAVNRIGEGMTPLVYSVAVAAFGLAAPFMAAALALASGVFLVRSLKRLLPPLGA